jgi:hypothetical protein
VGNRFDPSDVFTAIHFAFGIARSRFLSSRVEYSIMSVYTPNIYVLAVLNLMFRKIEAGNQMLRLITRFLLFRKYDYDSILVYDGQSKSSRDGGLAL